MNYLETGLSHTEFFPRKTYFHPPRFMPLCSLGRKYLGLEPLRRDELDGIISRLTRPKRKHEQPEVSEKDACEPDVTVKSTRRFVGRKRMSSFEIEKMVERLYSRRQTKDFEFVDNTFESADFINMTNRDSDEESDDAFITPKLDEVTGKPSLCRARNLKLKEDTPCQSLHKHKSEFGEHSEPVLKQVTLDRIRDKHSRRTTIIDRRDSVRRDPIVDRLTLDASHSPPSFTNVKRDASSPKQTCQNSNYSYQLNRCQNENYVTNNRNDSHAPCPDNQRRVPRMIKTAEPWSRRTETVSRQVNLARRPHSNLQTETATKSVRVLNIKPGRLVRPEYALIRCDTDLPSISARPTAQHNQQPNNFRPPTDDTFIQQVACSNSPRAR